MDKISSIYIERVLGLPFNSLDGENSPESLALLKIVETFPWILEVADNKFDPEIAKLILIRESVNLKIKELQK